jgi:hypothetical protein
MLPVHVHRNQGILTSLLLQLVDKLATSLLRIHLVDKSQLNFKPQGKIIGDLYLSYIQNTNHKNVLSEPSAFSFNCSAILFFFVLEDKGFLSHSNEFMSATNLVQL